MRIAIVMLGLAFTNSVSRADDSFPDLWPLAIGNTWTYRVNAQDDRFITKVAGIEKIGDQLAFRVDALMRERVVASEFLMSDKNGLHRLRLDKDDIVPPLNICKIPAETPKRTAWRTNFRLGQRYSTVTHTMINEEVVTVPAGRFKAIRVDADTTDNGVRVRTSCWYAPKVGLVKQTIDEAKRVTTLELEKYEVK